MTPCHCICLRHLGLQDFYGPPSAAHKTSLEIAQITSHSKEEEEKRDERFGAKLGGFSRGYTQRVGLVTFHRDMRTHTGPGRCWICRLYIKMRAASERSSIVVTNAVISAGIQVAFFLLYFSASLQARGKDKVKNE